MRSQKRFPYGFRATGPPALLRALPMTTGIGRGPRRAKRASGRRNAAHVYDIDHANCNDMPEAAHPQ